MGEFFGIKPPEKKASITHSHSVISDLLHFVMSVYASFRLHCELSLFPATLF
jgi:hypothetical protein